MGGWIGFTLFILKLWSCFVVNKLILVEFDSNQLSALVCKGLKFCNIESAIYKKGSEVSIIGYQQEFKGNIGLSIKKIFESTAQLGADSIISRLHVSYHC